MFDDLDNEEIKGIEKSAGSDDSYFSDTLPRGYLSVSQVTQYHKCGEAYRRRYILEERIASTGFQVQGRAVHKAAEILHNSMIGGAPISVQEMESVYSDLHDTEIKDATLNKDEENADKLKDTGITLTRLYHSAAFGQKTDPETGLPYPAIKPVAAERIVRAAIEHPRTGDLIPFMGVIDLEEEDGIRDLKTKKKAASQIEVDNSLQLTLYAHITGKPDVRLDQLVRPTKTKPARYVRKGAIRTKSETLHAVDIVAEVATDIAAGRFRKTSPENWWCDKNWCPYWGDCRGRKR